MTERERIALAVVGPRARVLTDDELVEQQRQADAGDDATLGCQCKREADLRFEDHGSVVLVLADSDAGLEWLTHKVATASWQWLGPKAIGIDRRFASDLVSVAVDDGLHVEA